MKKLNMKKILIGFLLCNITTIGYGSGKQPGVPQPKSTAKPADKAPSVAQPKPAPKATTVVVLPKPGAKAAAAPQPQSPEYEELGFVVEQERIIRIQDPVERHYSTLKLWDQTYEQCVERPLMEAREQSAQAGTPLPAAVMYVGGVAVKYRDPKDPQNVLEVMPLEMVSRYLLFNFTRGWSLSVKPGYTENAFVTDIMEGWAQFRGCLPDERALRTIWRDFYGVRRATKDKIEELLHNMGYLLGRTAPFVLEQELRYARADRAFGPKMQELAEECDRNREVALTQARNTKRSCEERLRNLARLEAGMVAKGGSGEEAVLLIKRNKAAYTAEFAKPLGRDDFANKVAKIEGILASSTKKSWEDFEQRSYGYMCDLGHMIRMLQALRCPLGKYAQVMQADFEKFRTHRGRSVGMPMTMERAQGKQAAPEDDERVLTDYCTQVAEYAANSYRGIVERGGSVDGRTASQIWDQQFSAQERMIMHLVDHPSYHTEIARVKSTFLSRVVKAPGEDE